MGRRKLRWLCRDGWCAEGPEHAWPAFRLQQERE